MPEKSIDVLFVELSELKRDLNDSLTSTYRRFADDNFPVDYKEVKLHRMKLQSMSKTCNILLTDMNHYLAMAELRLATLKVVQHLQTALASVDTQ